MVILTKASTISSFVFGLNVGSQQPSTTRGQCRDWQVSSLVAFRQSSSAATSRAPGEADLRAASITRMAVSCETLGDLSSPSRSSGRLPSGSQDHRSTRRTTASSAWSSLVSAKSPEANAAGCAGPESRGETSCPARIAASSRNCRCCSSCSFSSRRSVWRLIPYPISDTDAVTSTPMYVRMAASCDESPVPRSWPCSSTAGKRSAASTVPHDRRVIVFGLLLTTSLHL